jgi:hypothetical protein
MTDIVFAAATAQSAPVTNWPVRLLLVVLVFGVIALVLWGMRRGWRNRQRRQADLDEPAAIPDGLAPDAESVSGVYLGSVMAGDWLDRIAAHGLGTRSRVDAVVVDAGIAVQRPGARSFFIPADHIVAIRRERGIAGKAFEKDAVVVVTWMLGDTAIDTGIRPDHTDDGGRLSEQVQRIAGSQIDGSSRDGSE